MMNPRALLTLLCILPLACHKADSSRPPPESAATTIVQGPNTSLVTAPSAPPVAQITRTLVARDDIARQPGYETRLYLIEVPPGAETKPHVHPTPGVGYVLEGSFESSFDKGAVEVKRAGDSFVDQANKTHHFRNASRFETLKFVVAGTYKKGEEPFREVP